MFPYSPPSLAARALPHREIPAPRHEKCEKCGLVKGALHRPNGSAEHGPGMRGPKANDSPGYQPHHFPCTPKWVRESGRSPHARCSSIDPHLLAPPWGAGDFWMCRVPGNRPAHPRAGVSAPVGGVVSEQPTIPAGLTTMRLHPALAGLSGPPQLWQREDDGHFEQQVHHTGGEAGIFRALGEVSSKLR
jgi:hypothetical protein